ncbi:VWA domain-containing protein [Thiospirillum jenense]|uniref:VWA domain-containing protein n=1 Tax=Thiospirillum jenense TaxID=1653858 RepID=A0A839HE93_9GAMM|nr:VWA domain-containing protein [Thiospirillum jenense]MBB1126961.1 VWA domain-containing protein [Thiospirillum jenense]
MWQNFHFLNPWWLIAILPLGGWLWWHIHRAIIPNATAWQQVIEPQFLQLLLPNAINQRRLSSAIWLLVIGWFIAVLSLANPTWERRPLPVIHTQGAARIIVLDLSQSMLTTDLTPTRLDRARYKVRDLLARSGDGQIGLVVFAGAAFTVVPLSDDVETVRTLLDGLSPDIMPVAGSRPDLGLMQAADLLKQSGVQRGDIVLVTDDAGDQRAHTVAATLHTGGVRTSVLGVGTGNGGTVPDVQTPNNQAVFATLDSPALQALADSGGGVYATLATTDQDINALLSLTRQPIPQPLPEQTARYTETWYGLGAWLALGLLPLGALVFRRGWLFSIMMTPILIMTLTMMPTSAQALTWNDLWQRRDQQVDTALKNGDLNRAQALANTPSQRGAVYYRQGQYHAAAQAFAAGKTAIDQYNRGNALAQAGELNAAIAAYDAALAQNPQFDDARYNRDLVQRQLDQQQNQETSDQQDQSNQPNKSNQNNQSDQSNNQRNQSDQSNDADQTDPPDSNTDQSNQSNPATAPEQKSPNDSHSNQPHQTQSAAPQSANSDQITPNDTTQTEAAAADYRQQAAASENNKAENKNDDGTAGEQLTPLSTAQREMQQATEQWLRRIPDDPAALLRRKFLYQYQQRAAPQLPIETEKTW